MSLKTAMSIKASSVTVYCTDVARSNGQTAPCTKASLERTKSLAKAHTSGLTALTIKDKL